MLKEGTYSVWFRTPTNQGMGIVQIAGGQVVGGDSVLSYEGCYELDGDRFTARVTTWRHTEGVPSVFGPDELTLSLEGCCNQTNITCRGTAAEAPGVPFEATLLLSQADETSPRPQRSLPKFDPRRLPKPLSR